MKDHYVAWSNAHEYSRFKAKIWVRRIMPNETNPEKVYTLGLYDLDPRPTNLLKVRTATHGRDISETNAEGEQSILRPTYSPRVFNKEELVVTVKARLVSRDGHVYGMDTNELFVLAPGDFGLRAEQEYFDKNGTLERRDTIHCK